MQKDKLLGVQPPVPFAVNGSVSPESTIDKTMGLPNLKASIEEAKILASDHLSKLQEAQEDNYVLLKQLEDLQVVNEVMKWKRNISSLLVNCYGPTYVNFRNTIDNLTRSLILQCPGYSNPFLEIERMTFIQNQIITRQCLESLDYLHGLGIIHCDLKPKNILIKSYSRCEIKVIDLGSSCFENNRLSMYVQSRSYRAREVILCLPYDQKVDLWSQGCILAKLASANHVLLPNEDVVFLLEFTPVLLAVILPPSIIMVFRRNPMQWIELVANLWLGCVLKRMIYTD
ncbi:Protein kinase, catalytic domain-containing protein [Artemisia annua]|uniref:Protein kinase, catalytic domain-containing protein n=1 Tax=Artemisia annua TaxID=35608 RepID=A0A2U1MQB5_ARTAN|nr:Protein kinase, catalytic domain-containing protein [Artemisia annua]